MTPAQCFACGSALEGRHCPRCDVDVPDGGAPAPACPRCAEMERICIEEQGRTRKEMRKLTAARVDRDHLQGELEQWKRETARWKSELERANDQLVGLVEAQRAVIGEHAHCAEARERLQARVQKLRGTRDDWIKQNAPGGWIDNLRKERDALQARVQELEARQCPETCYPPTTGRCELIHERDRLQAEVGHYRTMEAEWDALDRSQKHENSDTSRERVAPGDVTGKDKPTEPWERLGSQRDAGKDGGE